MKQIRWIIQDSNFSNRDRSQILEACQSLSIPCIQIPVIPFADNLPNFPLDENHENIYYGSTTMMDRIYQNYDKPLGLFYDKHTFSMENYLKQWGNYMLSSEAQFMTFREFSALDFPNDRQFFIRPDSDSKAFAGIVLEFGKIQDWYERLSNDDIYGLGPDTKIMVGPAYHIEKEWRNYIVEGKVVTSSTYRKNFRLYKSGTDIPPEMIAFVEARCREYQPHDVFAMDIAKCSGKNEYYIIECGCMNSVGFYASNIYTYVEALTNYVKLKTR
ncbi:MAG: ATP-grasp domain-containing protein [Saprospiraceae bacterium]|nr:ATP-grasp domain-containing protein [Saprospiraceae bacterium]